MNVLIVGHGGREHALAWKIAQSPRVRRVFVAPGNAGTALDAENVGISTADHAGLIKFARQQQVGLTVIGPEGPLAGGIVDAFQRAGLRIFGPTRGAARLESSKVFCKNLLHSADVPTADYQVFTDPESACRYVQDRYLRDDEDVPLVVKADGLAAGKGVLVCSNRREALDAIDRVARRREFGEAGRVVKENRQELMLFGNPDTVAQRLEWMRDELGVNYIMCWMNMGGLEQSKVLRSMDLFATEVMPRFRAARVAPK